MTEQQTIDLIDERYRGRPSWREFVGYPSRMDAPEPIESAIKLARSLGLTKLMASHVASEIVGLMLMAFEAGQETTEQAVRDAM